MKKNLLFFAIFFFFSFEVSYSKNFIVYLKDNSRIISNEFSLPLDKEKKDDLYNPNLRATDLNISQIEYTSDKDSLVHYILKPELFSKVLELDFIEEVPGISNSYTLAIKFDDNRIDNSSNAKFFRYSGNSTPSKKISVLRFDEYNNTWIPEYLDFSMVDKIEFRKRSLKQDKDSTREDELLKEENIEEKKSELKKKLLFSSDSFDQIDFAEKLKNTMLDLKNNKNEYGTSIVLRVNFDFDSSKIDSKAASFLDSIARVIGSPEFLGTRLSLRGFTDSTGEEKYNLLLSKRRAESVKAYLQKSNVSPSRIESQGFGKAMPILPNTNEYYKSMNRRVEIYPLFF
ncbi:MAG: OmpA family protein [Desulforegulaceae bacterium]|nr:OmpA family protein [Desulforegulaceae bacterium]